MASSRTVGIVIVGAALTLLSWQLLVEDYGNPAPVLQGAATTEHDEERLERVAEAGNVGERTLMHSTEEGGAVAGVAPPAPASSEQRGLSPEVLDALGHESVQAIAAHTGGDPIAIAEDLLRVWPGIMDRELKPLQDWSSFKDTIPFRVDRGWFGKPQYAEGYFQVDVLGDPVDEYVRNLAGEDFPETQLQQIEAAVEDMVFSVRADYEVYRSEFGSAISHKVSADDFDHSPHFILDDFRQTGNHDERKGFMSFAANFDGWSVNIKLFEGEFPSLQATKADYDAKKAALMAEIEAYLATHGIETKY